jgi:hypothetical protein
MAKSLEDTWAVWFGNILQKAKTGFQKLLKTEVEK